MGDFESAYDTIQRQHKEITDLRRQLEEAKQNCKVADEAAHGLQREVERLREAMKRIRARIGKEMRSPYQPMAYDPGTCEGDGLEKALDILDAEFSAALDEKG